MANEIIHADDTGAFGRQSDGAAFGRPGPYLGGGINGRFRGTYPDWYWWGTEELSIHTDMKIRKYMDVLAVPALPQHGSLVLP